MHNKLMAWVLAGLLLAACAGAANPPADLEARVSTLEAQVGIGVGNAGHDAFGVAMAQYVMDTAGFHDMDEVLNETKAVDPAYLSAVNRVRKVVAQAPWPEALHEKSESFVNVLDEFAAALDADNGEEAATLATEVHEVQHDFSHAIDDWLGGSEGGHGHEE